MTGGLLEALGGVVMALSILTAGYALANMDHSILLIIPFVQIALGLTIMCVGEVMGDD